MPRFQIEQIALAPRHPSQANELLEALGLTEWVHDVVDATGTVYGSPDCANRAHLAFNYQCSDRELGPALELEVLNYTSGENWVDMGNLRNSVSHLGMHVTEGELAGFHKVFEAHGISIVQEVDTHAHTNPYIANSRRYHYRIYGTREIIGVDLKFIVRKALPTG